jgi:hypothetical protein
MHKLKHGLKRAMVMTGLCVTCASCSNLPDLPTDPTDRCEALGGVAMTLPPTVSPDGHVTPGEFHHCMRNVHASEKEVREAQRDWHERNKQRLQTS